MTARLLLSLVLLSLTPALAQQTPVPSGHRRPAVCFGAWSDCATCAELAEQVRAYAARYDERAAADVVDVQPQPNEIHDHLVSFFSDIVIRRDDSPIHDLNDVRVKLLWFDAAGRPTDAEQGFTVLKVGDRVFNAPGELEALADPSRSPVWAKLAQALWEFKLAYRGQNPAGLPVLVDARRRVPARIVRLALDEVAELYDRAFRMLPSAPGAPPLTQGWDPRRVAGRRSSAPAPLDPPIIILEEEVEVTEDDPETPDPAQPGDAIPGGGAAPQAGPLSLRWGKGSLAREGGSEVTEAAVSAALRWLQRHQAPDGRWDGDGWTGLCVGDACARPGTALADSRYDVGLTSLALLAYLGNGHSHRFGTHKRVVARGLRWLKTQQEADGSVGFNRSESIYNHALATQALCEAYASTKDFTLEEPAKRAVAFVLQAQNPGLGWKYGVRSGRNDTSVTCAMMSALRAAREAGLEVPQAAADGARDWLRRTTARDGSVGYETPGGGSAFLAQNDGRFDPLPVMTAASVYTRLGLGEPRDLEAIQQGMRQLVEEIPDWAPRKLNFYYWYYGTLATFQVGGKGWRAWNLGLQAALLPNQRRADDCAAGSWDPSGEWCLAGGRVYATAINALSLEVYYRYERYR